MSDAAGSEVCPRPHMYRAPSTWSLNRALLMVYEVSEVQAFLKLRACYHVAVEDRPGTVRLKRGAIPVIGGSGPVIVVRLPRLRKYEQLLEGVPSLSNDCYYDAHRCGREE